MPQGDLLEQMAQLATQGSALSCGAALSSLLEMLVRLRPVLQNEDYERLLIIGAALWRCASLERRMTGAALVSGGTG